MWIGTHGVVLGFTVCCCFFCVLERNVEMLVTNHLFEVKNPVFSVSSHCTLCVEK